MSAAVAGLLPIRPTRSYTNPRDVTRLLDATGLLTDTAEVSLSVVRIRTSRRLAAVVARAHASAGRNRIVWNRPLARKRATPGRYRVRVTATVDGRHTVSSLVVRLR